MSDSLTDPIVSVAEFLIHALELEMESAERYRELADSMQIHNNPDVATLFRKLAVYGDAHAVEVKQRAAGIELPTIPPWEFKWKCPEGPESGCIEDTHYLMNRCQALELALHNEERGEQFYAQVADTSPDAEVRRLAAEMAEEERGHVAMLREWITREACRSTPALEDLDPPNVTE